MKKNRSAIEPFAIPFEDAPGVSGLSRTHLYSARKAGKLTVRKRGSANLIEMDELKRYVRSLPFKGRDPDDNAAA